MRSKPFVAASVAAVCLCMSGSQATKCVSDTAPCSSYQVVGVSNSCWGSCCGVTTYTIICAGEEQTRQFSGRIWNQGLTCTGSYCTAG